MGEIKYPSTTFDIAGNEKELAFYKFVLTQKAGYSFIGITNKNYTEFPCYTNLERGFIVEILKKVNEKADLKISSKLNSTEDDRKEEFSRIEKLLIESKEAKENKKDRVTRR